MDFTEINRNKLITYNNVQDLLMDSILGDQIVKGFESYLLDEDIIDESLPELYHFYLHRQLLAFVARHIWDEQEYYRAINYDQTILNKAIEVIDGKEFNWDELSYK